MATSNWLFKSLLNSFQANLIWHKNFKTQLSCNAQTASRLKLCAHCLHGPLKLQANRLELPPSSKLRRNWEMFSSQQLYAKSLRSANGKSAGN